MPHGLHLYLNFYKYYFICISYQIVLGFCIITCATNMLTNGNYCQILERKISFIQVQLKLCNIAVFMCCWSYSWNIFCFTCENWSFLICVSYWFYRFGSRIFCISLLEYFKLFLILNFCIYCQDLIQHLKYTCPAHLYATSISPPAAQQIISSIRVILGEDGSNRGLAGTSSALCFAFVLFDDFLCASIQIIFVYFVYRALK